MPGSTAAGASTPCWASRPGRTPTSTWSSRPTTSRCCGPPLSEAGFVVLRDWLPTALAVRHPDGRELDLHPVRPTDDGGGDQELSAPDPPFHCGPPVVGLLSGEEVLCVSAESQLRAHQGYEAQPEDRADVAALADRSGLPLPPGY